MYHTEKINQAPNQINLNFTRFSSKDLHTDHYISQLTRYERFLYHELLLFSDCNVIRPSNEYLASKAGCSIRTVIRATNKFHQDGFIIKQQISLYSTNHYTFTDKAQRGMIDNKNKSIISQRNVTPTLRSSLNINLFINLSPSSRRRERTRTVFKKTYPEKGEIVNNFKRQSLRLAKPQEKLRNRNGHSPQVLKPILPLKDQIHAKKVDIAFFEKQLEKPEAFWDHRSILFEAQITMAKSLLARAKFELNELEGNSDEKQSILRQSDPYSMATCSA